MEVSLYPGRCHFRAEKTGEYCWLFAGRLTSICLSVLGDKGISKIITASKGLKTGKLAERAEKLRVNTGVTPALEAAGAGPAKIPYNVVDDLGVRIQKATEERWGSNKGTTKPLQKHHYATNKSKKYTPQMENITKKYGLDLDNEWNKELLPHQGRHPYAYHDYVLDKLSTYDRLAKGDREKFLKLFEGLKQEVRDNPDMLYKDYWRSK